MIYQRKWCRTASAAAIKLCRECADALTAGVYVIRSCAAPRWCIQGLQGRQLSVMMDNIPLSSLIVSIDDLENSLLPAAAEAGSPVAVLRSLPAAAAPHPPTPLPSATSSAPTLLETALCAAVEALERAVWCRDAGGVPGERCALSGSVRLEGKGIAVKRLGPGPSSGAPPTPSPPSTPSQTAAAPKTVQKPTLFVTSHRFHLSCAR